MSKYVTTALWAWSLYLFSSSQFPMGSKSALISWVSTSEIVILCLYLAQLSECLSSLPDKHWELATVFTVCRHNNWRRLGWRSWDNSFKVPQGEIIKSTTCSFLLNLPGTLLVLHNFTSFLNAFLRSCSVASRRCEVIEDVLNNSLVAVTYPQGFRLLFFIVLCLDVCLQQWNGFMYLMVPKFELFPFKSHTTTVNIHESGRSLGTGVQREVESGVFRIIMDGPLWWFLYSYNKYSE